ncbi:MAG: ABC transporter ATP-binding protein [Desulfotomaculaceae bacterium]|nr:ABC transporter ATP-binding protein [Desulfotomaculaceae bacterium]MDD4767862.1 ABC transporter ATP-binding protein [Desulfotomaculaceae bacterium]
MPEIVVEGVSKTLGGMLTLGGVNLKAGDRDFAGILGPSGCGKSTLFNIISGLMRPDQGRVYIDGLDVTGRTGRVSYMRQKDLLLPSLNIVENVSIPLALKGMPKKRACAQAAAHFKQFGLDGFEKYYPSQLSGGMRQRAAMLRTYLFSSDILLLDEPFASLDAITKRKMQAWLIEVFNAISPTVMYITHDVDEALYLCDRIYVLSACPTVVKLEITVPFCRPPHGRTIVDREYGVIRDKVMEALEI